MVMKYHKLVSIFVSLRVQMNVSHREQQTTRALDVFTPLESRVCHKRYTVSDDFCKPRLMTQNPETMCYRNIALRNIEFIWYSSLVIYLAERSGTSHSSFFNEKKKKL